VIVTRMIMTRVVVVTRVFVVTTVIMTRVVVVTTVVMTRVVVVTTVVMTRVFVVTTVIMTRMIMTRMIMTRMIMTRMIMARVVHSVAVLGMVMPFVVVLPRQPHAHQVVDARRAELVHDRHCSGLLEASVDLFEVLIETTEPAVVAPLHQFFGVFDHRGGRSVGGLGEHSQSVIY